MVNNMEIEKKWIEFCTIGDKDPNDPELAHMRGVFFSGAMAACSILVGMIRTMDLEIMNRISEMKRVM